MAFFTAIATAVSTAVSIAVSAASLIGAGASTAAAAVGGWWSLGGLAIGLGSGIAGGVTSIVQGQQQAAMAESNAKLAEQQAELAQKQAQKEALAKENDTRERLRLERLQQESIKATIRNQSGNLGIVETSGTMLLNQIKNAENMEFNNQQIWRAAQVEAQDIRDQGAMNAWSSNAQASQFRSAASNARFGGWMNATSSFLGSAANTALMGYGMSKK